MLSIFFGIMNQTDPSDLFFSIALVSMYLMCPLTIISLNFTTAPYGKHLRSGWGPTLPAPLAWFLMESPSLWLTLLLLYYNPSIPMTSISFLTISLFLLHYTHRTIIYPLRLLATTGKRVPVSIAFLAFFFNLHNAYLQARSVTHHYPATSIGFWIWIRIVLGVGMFFWGMAVNITSDLELLRMKKEGRGGGYRIPMGGWFEVVCSPNYMGEVVEWMGWAVLAWSPAALAFFLYTCSNLVPRARANLRWYQEKFGEEYPSSRKAVVPFLY